SQPDPLDRHASKVPRALVAIVAKALLKDAGGRFASAQELHKALVAARASLDSTDVQTTPAESTRGIDSLAVLPFVNASGDPDTEYLSDGITESLINRVSQIP